MRKKNKEYYLEKFRNIHGEIYDYSLVNYQDCSVPVDIVCRIHGSFSMLIYNHIRGDGCKQCAETASFTHKLNQWIEKSNVVHNYKYDYSKSLYTGSRGKVVITCPVHGDFEQFAESHKNGHGCMKCYADSMRFSHERIISEFNNVHGNLYDYSLVEYTSAKKKVKIICSKHGIFTITPNMHKMGKGCPVCKSSRGEISIVNFLNVSNINYEREWVIGDNPETGKAMFCDFYIESLDTVIEFDGEQHYQPIEHFGGLDTHFKVVRRDQIKDQMCEQMGLNVIRIPYTDLDKVEDILYFELIARTPFHELEIIEE